MSTVHTGLCRQNVNPHEVLSPFAGVHRAIRVFTRPRRERFSLRFSLTEKTPKPTRTRVQLRGTTDANPPKGPCSAIGAAGNHAVPTFMWPAREHRHVRLTKFGPRRDPGERVALSTLGIPRKSGLLVLDRKSVV